MEKQEKIKQAYSGIKSYPELVKNLISIGVRSYTVDTATGTILYRFGGGEDYLHLGEASRTIHSKFNNDETVMAIRTNQRGKSTYPEFMEQIAAAGVRFYEATLEGNRKRVTYIGSGGSYEELIPV